VRLLLLAQLLLPVQLLLPLVLPKLLLPRSKHALVG